MTYTTKSGVELVDADEAARLLGISRVHLGRLVKAGTISAGRFGQGARPALVFELADVEALRDERKAS